MKEMIDIIEISKTYDPHKALDNVSFTINEGVIFGLLGPNGAGKTTLIRMLTQIIAQDTGRILLHKKSLSRTDVERFGYLPEERGLYKHMQVGQHLMYLAMLKGLSSQAARRSAHAWLEKFEAETWWGKRISELSKGMQQKVQFIATVLFDPDIIILDEPFSGFDPINSQMVKEEIVSLKKHGKTIILSTHNMYSVEELCDEIALLHRGRVLHAGKIQPLKERFSKNIIEISIKDTLPDNLLIPDNARLISKEQSTDDITKIQISVESIAHERTLLQQLIMQYHIVSFHRVYPSMQDVFIELIKQSNNG